MLVLYSDRWWHFAIRGAAALVLGAIFLIRPGIGLILVLSLFGALAVLNAFFSFKQALDRKKAGKRWGFPLMEGVLGLLVGALVVFAPGFAAYSLLLLLAAWAFLTGVIQISDAVSHRSELAMPVPFALGGVLSVLLGILILVWPTSSVVAIVWVLGAYCLLSGVLFISLSLRLRSSGKHRVSER